MSPPRIALVGALSVVAAALGWLGFREAMLRTLPPQAPLVTAIAPDAGSVIAREIVQRLSVRRDRVDPRDIGRAQLLLDVQPLADEPMLLLGAQAAARGDRARAIRYLEEARRRAPRQRLTRVLLLEQYALANDVPRTTAELRTLARLVPQAGDALVRTFALVLLNPPTTAAAAAALREDKALADRVVTQVAQLRPNPVTIVAAARSLGAPIRDGGAGASWRTRLVELLVDRGRPDEARRWWARFAGVATPPAGLYDPEFRGAPGAAPFNWSLTTDELGVAEPRRKGGLSVEFYGRRSGVLATQTLVLKPGRYRLSFTAEGNAPGTAARLSWRITCRPSDTVLGVLPIQDVKSSTKRFAGSFVVPATGCPAQTLDLAALASEFPSSQAFDLDDLRLSAVKP